MNKKSIFGIVIIGIAVILLIASFVIKPAEAKSNIAPVPASVGCTIELTTTVVK